MISALDIAETYLLRGWQPVPVPYRSKAPLDAEWQTRVITLMDVAEYFDRVTKQNIGVALGKPSGGLVDIDLDCAEAIRLADIFLPPTEARFGRLSKPNSHWLYISDLWETEHSARTACIDPTKDKSGKNVTIAELRTGGGGRGAQTIFPGSVHDTGEAVVWESEGEPAQVGGAELKRRFGQLAAAVLLVRNYRGEGARHEAALTLGGVLARALWSDQAIEDYVGLIARTAGDTEWRERGKSAAAAVAIFQRGNKVRGWPSFARDWDQRVSERFSDWTGIKPTAQDQSPNGQSAPQPAGAGSGLMVSNRNQPLSNLANVKTLLSTAPELADLLRYDEMLHLVILQRPVPGTPAVNFVARPTRDADAIALQVWMQHHGLPTIQRKTVEDGMLDAAQQRPFHPVRDWLERLGWDGQQRLETFMPVYFGTADTPYTHEIGLRFMLSMVARIFQPGCQVDYMLVLEGAQGTFKSSACRILGDQWYSSTPPDLTQGKDAMEHLRGLWLVEFSELNSIKRAEITRLKSFISDPVDRFREPYGRASARYPRQCVFIGTTNEAQYLRDQTGNRRFWPIRCGRVEIDFLRQDREQLFAEATSRFMRGEAWWPSAGIEDSLIRPEQEQRREVDAWEPLIAEWFAMNMPGPPIRTPPRFFVYEVAENAIGLPKDRLHRAEQLRITDILRRLGCEQVGRISQGRFWTPPPVTDEPSDDSALS